MIVAHDINHVIGKDNSLIWHISEDLKHFKKLTTGKNVVMGRKTYESIGRLLPNRTNIIITRDKSFELDGAKIYNSIEDMLSNESDIIILGGSNIYEQFLEKVDILYSTEIQHEFDGDSYFPKYKHLFDLKSCEEVISEKDKYVLHFNTYYRKS